MNNKKGRPPKKSSEKKRYQINVKLNIEEYVFLKSRVRKSGLPINDFIRECIGKSVIIQRLTIEEMTLLKQLAGMANNWNQITKRINGHGFESSKNEYLYLAEKVDKIIKQILSK